MTDSPEVPSYAQQQEQSQGLNPAWNSLLDHIPEDARGDVQPILQDWDKGVQQRFDSLHDRYRPYDHIVSQGIDPSDIDYSLNLMRHINTNEGALEVYRALEQHLRENSLLDAIEEQEAEEVDSGDSSAYARQIAELEKNFGMLAEYFLNKDKEAEQAAQEAYEDQLLEQELEAARAKYGDFDEREVLMRLAANDDMSIDDAVQDYNAFLARHNVRQAPRVLGQGGGDFPAQPSIDPRKLDNRQTQDLVADIIRLSQQNQ